MTNLTDSEKQILERLEAATPGPWYHGEIKWNATQGSHTCLIHAGEKSKPESPYSDRIRVGSFRPNDRDNRPFDKDEIDELPMEANVELVANAPTDIRQLLTIISELREENKRLMRENVR